MDTQQFINHILFDCKQGGDKYCCPGYDIEYFYRAGMVYGDEENIPGTDVNHYLIVLKWYRNYYYIRVFYQQVYCTTINGQPCTSDKIYLEKYPKKDVRKNVTQLYMNDNMSVIDWISIGVISLCAAGVLVYLFE